MNSFKFGDIVITSKGEMGVVVDVCDCDRCKSRGFYEPQIKTVVGSSMIWCTDSDKEDGFKSFYRIGDEVFGNIDKDGLDSEIDEVKHRIRSCEKELSEMMRQQAIVKSLIGGVE